MVFVSHSSRDENVTKNLIKKLENSLQNTKCTLTRDEVKNFWLAEKEIQAGDYYTKKIEEAINACEKFILIWTIDAMNSKHVQKELELAIGHSKKIIPICFNDNMVEQARKTYHLCTVQMIELSRNGNSVCTDDEGYRELLNEVRQTLWMYNVTICSGNEEGAFSLLRGDDGDDGFERNVEYLIKGTNEKEPVTSSKPCSSNITDMLEVKNSEPFEPIDLEKTVFAMGIDKTGKIDSLTHTGIAYALFNMFIEKYGLTKEEIQKRIDTEWAKINKEKGKSADTSSELEFGDILVIEVPILIEGKTKNIRLLLLVNSYYKNSLLKGPESTDISTGIIWKVFDKCYKLGDKAENLMIGAIGTNGLHHSYATVTAEIITAYLHYLLFSSKSNDGSPVRHLYYSIRNKDMGKTKTEDIYGYIQGALELFR